MFPKLRIGLIACAVVAMGACGKQGAGGPVNTVPGNVPATADSYVAVVDGLWVWQSTHATAPKFDKVKTKGKLQEFTVENATSDAARTNGAQATDLFRVKLTLADKQTVSTRYAYVRQLDSGKYSIIEE